jgi:hypothetical protein
LILHLINVFCISETDLFHRDLCRYRTLHGLNRGDLEKRIDYLFARGRSATTVDGKSPPGSPPLTEASHDLNCGEIVQDPEEQSCDLLDNPERYSDHRLVWGFVGPIPDRSP